MKVSRIICLWMIACLSIQASTLTVGKSSGTYNTITAALSVAQNGDAIEIIDNQIYTEAITISRSVTLQGNIKNRPTIQAPSTIAQDGSVILIQSANVTIMGLIVDCQSLCWQGIYCWNTTISIEETIVQNALRNGIFCNSVGTTTRLSHNTIQNNIRNGIYCWNNSSPEISTNLIQDNGKAIGCQSGSSPRIYQNTILRPDSIAIYTYDNESLPVIGGSLINANTISPGDSGYIGTPSTRLDSINARYNYWQTTNCDSVRIKMDTMVQWIPFTNQNHDQALYCSLPPPVLVSPASGNIISSLSVQLDWKKVDNASSYQLQLATDSAFTQIKIHEPSLVDTFTILSNLQQNTRYYWRIIAQTSNETSQWSNPFYFNTYGMQILSPNGQENWPAGSSQSIRWRTIGIIRSFFLYYSVNNGKSYSVITSLLGSDSTYLWKVPDTSSEQCLIKIENINTPTIFDLSDQPFRITREWIKLKKKSYPLRYMGQRDTIRWEFGGTQKQFSIYLWDIKRQKRTILSTSVDPSAQGYIWSIPTNFDIVEQGYVKIYSTSDSTVFDTMNYTISRYNPLQLFAAPRITSLSHQTAEIRWTLNRPAICNLYYSDQSDNLGSTQSGIQDQNEYFAVLEQLIPAKPYYYRIKFTDSTGNRDSSQIYSFQTLRTYQTKNISINNKPEILYTNTSIIILRYLTDLPLAGSGHLRLNNQILQSKYDSLSSTRHTYYFEQLSANTIYEFMAGSIEPTGAPYISPYAFTVRTTSLADTTPPILISGPWVTASNDRVSISFTTDEGCKSQITLVADQINQPVYQAENSTFLKEHHYIIMNLESKTGYSFQLILTDPAGYQLQWNGEKSLLARLNLEITDNGNQFTTGSQADITSPRFTLPPHIMLREDSVVILNWQSNEASAYRIDLKNSFGETIHFSEGIQYQARTYCPISRLFPLSNYIAQICLIDLNGNESSYQSLPFMTRKNSSAVQVKLLGPLDVFTTDNVAVVRWTTNLACDSRLIIGQNYQPTLLGDWHSNTIIDLTHLVIVPQLQSQALYYIQPQGYNLTEHRVLEGSIDSVRIKPAGDQSDYLTKPFSAYTADSFMIIQWKTKTMTQNFIDYYPHGDTSARIQLYRDEMLQQHSMPLMSLQPQTIYTITVQSRDYDGQTSTYTFSQTTSTSPYQDLTPPSPVSAVALSWDSSACFILNWEASPSSDVLNYIVFRKTDQTEKLWQSKLKNTTILDDDLQPGITYQYGIGAVDWYGNTSPIVYSSLSARISDDNLLPSKRDWNAQIYPNPFSNWTGIYVTGGTNTRPELRLYSILGEIVYHEFMNNGKAAYQYLNTSAWPSGLYIYRISASNQPTLTGKLIKLK